MLKKLKTLASPRFASFIKQLATSFNVRAAICDGTSETRNKFCWLSLNGQNY